MSPDPMITRLAQPLLALRTSLGTAGDVSATGNALAAASQHIEQIAVGGQSPLAGLPAVWDGPAAGAAQARVGRLQAAAGQIADRGTRIGPILTQAAADLNADRQQLDAIIAQFMSLGELDPQVLHSASGVTAAIALANHALQQGLAVVSHAGASLADATRSLNGLTPPLDQVPGAMSENGIVDAVPDQDRTSPADAWFEPDHDHDHARAERSVGVFEADGRTLDPMRTLGNALTTAGASAVGEVAGFVVGDLGTVLGDVTKALGTVISHVGDAAGAAISHVGDAAGALIDNAAHIKHDGADAGPRAGERPFGDAADSGAAPALGQAPFGPPPGTSIDGHKPIAKPAAPPAAAQEPFGGAPAPQAPVEAAPPAHPPTDQGSAQAAPQAPDLRQPDQADGSGGTAPLVPLPGGHGPADAPKHHRGQAGVTDAGLEHLTPPLPNALTA
jgi:hypothetical protein